jgi:uncharacterized membrane protein YphA (DoxX/SURF4 family)
MNTLLWTCQILTAIIFLYSGINKSTLSQQALVAKGQTGITGLGSGLIQFIGIAEILGAIGLVFPTWLRIAPVLTPIAAICFAVVMILAALTHARLALATHNKKELRNIMTNAVLLALMLLIAWGRMGKI